MDKKILNHSKLIEKITIGVDGLFAVIYIIVFGYFFSLIYLPNQPVVTGEQQNEINNRFYQTVFGEMGNGTLNFWMSILAIIMIISIPMIVINLKNLANKDDYDYDKYSALNKFIQGTTALFELNPISAGLRYYNTFVVLQYAEGYGFVGALKHFGAWVKNLFAKKEKVVKEHKELSEEEVRIKRSIRLQTTSKIIRLFVTYLFLSLIALFIFIPFYWMVITSLRTYQESNISTNPRFFLPLDEFQWINIKYVLENMNFGTYIYNTLLVGILSTVGTLVTTVLAAFAFSRLEFKGREAIFSVLLMTMMIPGELYIITNFLTVSKNGFGWIGNAEGNNYFLAMIVPFMTSVFYVFFLRQTFKQIPDSLYRAAKVDGCSDFKYLTRVMIPIAAPTIFTITILSVIGSWNAFIWPRLVTALDPINGQGFWLISVALRNETFVTAGVEGRAMFNLQIAASAIVTIPLLIVFLALRKFIMSGVGRSGTKG